MGIAIAIAYLIALIITFIVGIAAAAIITVRVAVIITVIVGVVVALIGTVRVAAFIAKVVAGSGAIDLAVVLADEKEGGGACENTKNGGQTQNADGFDLSENNFTKTVIFGRDTGHAKLKVFEILRGRRGSLLGIEIALTGFGDESDTIVKRDDIGAKDEFGEQGELGQTKPIELTGGKLDVYESFF